MRFDSEQAAIRFGCGLSPTVAPPTSVDEMLSMLRGPDRAAEQFPVAAFQHMTQRELETRAAGRQYRRGETEEERKAGLELRRSIGRRLRDEAVRWQGNVLLRRAMSPDALRERLTFFWADHFTAVGEGHAFHYSHLPYVETAIRPHVAGRFSDMLRAVVTSPLMLMYLDHIKSVGPNSDLAIKKDGQFGLNENLARELFELHTLGVEGPYSQGDVRELAELLSGLTYHPRRGMHYRDDGAEPGAETILGVSYGGGTPRLEDILGALDDLSVHPSTARHLSYKLAVHFVSDEPSEALVDAMTARYLDTAGELVEVYAAMLEHADAWDDSAPNVKQPLDFVGSSLRALGVSARHIPRDNYPAMLDMFQTPLATMGQQWGRPDGPDGWPEEDPEWVTPQRLAARIQWAMSVPFRLMRVLPDPREFVTVALGSRATEDVVFAARAAESRPEGIGVILSSPAFQRA